MVAKLKDIQLANNLLENFGGEEKVKELGKLKSFIRFYTDPYRIIIISPWSNPLDLFLFGYERGDDIRILDEEFNILSLTRIKEPTFNIQNIVITRDEEEVNIVEPIALREAIYNTKHADFIIVNFKNVYLALWINKELSNVRINKILDNWRVIQKQKEEDKLKSRIGIELLKAKNNDRLIIKVASVILNPEIKPIEEMKDVREVEFDYFEYPLFFYPDRSWWMTFTLEREGIEQSLRPKSLLGIGLSNFIETSEYLFSLQIDKQEVLANFNNSVRTRKIQIKGIISFESPSSIS